MMIRNKHKSNFKQKNIGSIRIIGGKYRGRKLPVISADGLRPTTDRIKETVFNWLMPYIHQAKCLDCFAGSGGLGFEALSRGAKQVTFLELNKNAAQQIQKNLLLLNANNALLVKTNSIDYLKHVNDCFDLVFLDPPFRQNILTEITDKLTQGWLAKQALIYVETEADIILVFYHKIGGC